jgi:hypothetical protein
MLFYTLALTLTNNTHDFPQLSTLAANAGENSSKVQSVNNLPYDDHKEPKHVAK